jgi:sortase (surface protein transpeptidase)
MFKRIILLFIIIILFCISIFSILYYFSNETEDIENQELISELVAEEYLIYVSQQSSEGTNQDVEPTVPTDSSDLDYTDNEIYSHFEESDAWGYIDCVLEIPAIDLRQSVFTGTPEQIQHDLKRWLSVTARSDYILGDTHYCIYMHNARNKSIKISYAQEKLREKDYMIVTKQNHVYLYQVTGVFGEWRNKCTDNYVNNMTVDNKKLYIFTCGRGEWQGKNLVIEGTVHAVYDTSDWVTNKDQYINEYKKDIGVIIEDPVVEKEQLVMNIETRDQSLIVSLHDENYANVSNCTVGICDVDGYLVEGVENPIPYNGSAIVIPNLPKGEYYIGVYENNTYHLDPIPYKVVIDQQTHTQSVTTVDQEALEQHQRAELTKSIAIIVSIAAIGLGIIVVIKLAFIKNKDII